MSDLSSEYHYQTSAENLETVLAIIDAMLDGTALASTGQATAHPYCEYLESLPDAQHQPYVPHIPPQY